jgi:hypothetical protein
MMLFLPPRKIVFLTSPLYFLFESTLHLSFPSLPLSLGFEELNPSFSRTVVHSVEKHKQQFIANITTDVLPTYTADVSG